MSEILRYLLDFHEDQRVVSLRDAEAESEYNWVRNEDPQRVGVTALGPRLAVPGYS
jgi:hypothetical protein